MYRMYQWLLRIIVQTSQYELPNGARKKDIRFLNPNGAKMKSSVCFGIRISRRDLEGKYTTSWIGKSENSS